MKAIKEVKTPAELAILLIGADAKPITTGGPYTKIVFSLRPWELTKGTVASTFNLKVSTVVPDIFEKFPLVQDIEIHGTMNFKDMRGNVREDDGVWVAFSRNNSATIKWQNIDRENIVQLSDRNWVHPAMREAFAVR